MDDELKNASIEERDEFVALLKSSLERQIEAVEIPKTQKAQAEAKARFDALSPEEQKQAVRM